MTSIEQGAANLHDKWGPYASTHEAYGVLAEEMHELLQAIHSNDLHHVATEAMQVAIVACKLAKEAQTKSFMRKEYNHQNP